MLCNSKTTWPKSLNMQYCCIVRLTLKKNNIFVNITNLKGQTIVKMSSGTIQKRKSKKQLRTVLKWIMEKISWFIKTNFDCIKIYLYGFGNNRSYSFLKEFKRHKLKIVYFENKIPIPHNGCRPPKKRRL